MQEKPFFGYRRNNTLRFCIFADEDCKLTSPLPNTPLSGRFFCDGGIQKKS